MLRSRRESTRMMRATSGATTNAISVRRQLR